MDGLFVFDQQNDLIYSNLNKEMKKKIYDLATQQELIVKSAVSKPK